MPDMNVGPDRSPSGKFMPHYGEITIGVWFDGTENDPQNSEAAIFADPKMPFSYFMIACEHLMTATAAQSGAGFNRALELLVEGAKSNNGRIIRKEGETEDEG